MIFIKVYVLVLVEELSRNVWREKKTILGVYKDLEAAREHAINCVLKDKGRNREIKIYGIDKTFHTFATMYDPEPFNGGRCWYQYEEFELNETEKEDADGNRPEE